jgi:hypothetical protein
MHHKQLTLHISQNNSHMHMTHASQIIHIYITHAIQTINIYITHAS